MTETLPLISCICVTRGKSKMLNRAINCFFAQTYFYKELVIVYEDDDDDTIAYLASDKAKLEDAQIQLVCMGTAPKAPLGELRNRGISVAKGEFICQWDDDDWYHSKRLEEQFRVLHESRCHGSILTRWLVFDSVYKKAYISNTRLWEGSILCRKSTMQLKPYEQKAIGEDTATIDYLDQLNLLFAVAYLPWLYIYIYHEQNTWGRAHWNYIFECSTALSAKDDKTIAGILAGQQSPEDASNLLDEIADRYRDLNKINN